MSLISIILPCFNEKNNISILAQEISSILYKYDFEIIVVDDNSPDGTFEFVKKLNLPNVKPILRIENRGLANSIRCGIENSSGDIIVVMDSDFNHQPEYLPFMIENIKYYECVLASRFLYGGRMEPRLRHILSWLFNFFIRIVTNGKITDSLYGYFAIKREVLERICFNDIFWGYGDYCIRLTYYLQKRNISILQFPAINGERFSGKENHKFLRVFWQYFKEVIKLVFQRSNR